MTEEKNKNYGLDIEKELADQDTRDWVFGAQSFTCIASVPEHDRQKYLPVGEVQKTPKEDMSDCASRAPVNILESKFAYLLDRGLLEKENHQWLLNNGYFDELGLRFSDAFVAINSGTTRNGNSLKAPCEAIRVHGMIPKSMLPLESWMTWDDYHDVGRITPEMRALGLEFKRRFTINYERVNPVDYETLLKEDFLVVGGYAWPRVGKNGVYPRTDNTPNHAFIVFRTPRFMIFDNYIDSHDGDFIKQLAHDYELMSYAYRIFVTAELKEVVNVDDIVEETPSMPLWKVILDWFKKIFNPQTV